MADLPIAETPANARSAIKDGTSQIPFSVTQQFGRLTFRIHTAFNTEVANCTREYLSLIAETVDSIWATVFQAHRIPAMQTNEFFVRTDEARLQKFMRHVSPPPPANVQIRGGECVYRWAEKLGSPACSSLWLCIQSISSLRRSLPSASANAKAIKRASGAIGAYFVSDKGNSSKPFTGLRCMYRDAREMNLLSYHCRQYALALPGKQIYSHGRV
jgi:hypothetical protein